MLLHLKGIPSGTYCEPQCHAEPRWEGSLGEKGDTHVYG